MAACFGLIISGRLVQTDFQQIDENKFLVNIPDADNINYLVKILSENIQRTFENLITIFLGHILDWNCTIAFRNGGSGVLELARSA